MKLELTKEEVKILKQAIYNTRSELRGHLSDQWAARAFAVLTKLHELVPEKELIITTVDH